MNSQIAKSLEAMNILKQLETERETLWNQLAANLDSIKGVKKNCEHLLFRRFVITLEKIMKGGPEVLLLQTQTQYETCIHVVNLSGEEEVDEIPPAVCMDATNTPGEIIGVKVTTGFIKMMYQLHFKEEMPSTLDEMIRKRFADDVLKKVSGIIDHHSLNTQYLLTPQYIEGLANYATELEKNFLGEE